MVKLEVNWARILFDTLVKEPSTFLPFGAFLTHIFRKFKLDLAFESNMVKVFEPFDRSVLLQMKLLETPPPQPTFLLTIPTEHHNPHLVHLLIPYTILSLFKSWISRPNKLPRWNHKLPL